MNEMVRELTREELVELNNKLRADLEEARLAVEHNRHRAEEERLRNELYRHDGIIYGLKYALRCNGISGGEMERRGE